MEEEELCFNGFCRAQNQGRMVLCVYIKKDGIWELEDVDCAYLNCKHKVACEIGKQIGEGPAGN